MTRSGALFGRPLAPLAKAWRLADDVTVHDSPAWVGAGLYVEPPGA